MWQRILSDTGETKNVLEGLFSEQENCILDESKLTAAVCSRRAGKTWGVTRKMVQTCQDNPNSLVGYITKTRDWAEELVWEPLKTIDREENLGMTFKEVKLKANFRKGSALRLAGAKDKAQAEVLRGFGYKLIVIDEAGSIAPSVMRYILRDILPAALGEHRGTLLMVGTPNESCSGYFHDMTNKQETGFSVHHWTQRDNIMFPRWVHITDPVERNRAVDAYLAEEREYWGYSEDDPEYQREYLGVWAKDDALFIYPITDSNIANPPNIPLKYILAIDLGWMDKTAFELIGYDQDGQHVYEIESMQHSGLTFDDIRSITHKHYAENFELERIVVDAAGAGKIVQESLSKEIGNRFGIACTAAQKNKKASFMKLLASDFRAGRVFLLDDVCADQMRSLQWDTHRLREKENQECDNADAYLYAYRECYHWLHEERVIIPEVGTRDYEIYQNEQMEAAQVERFERQQGESWWENA